MLSLSEGVLKCIDLFIMNKLVSHACNMMNFVGGEFWKGTGATVHVLMQPLSLCVELFFEKILKFFSASNNQERIWLVFYAVCLCIFSHYTFQKIQQDDFILKSDTKTRSSPT